MPDSVIAATPTLRQDGAIAILDLGDGENRLNPESVARINACLDEVERSNAEALVTTAQGKIWCNGLDLAWLVAHADRAVEAITAIEELFARMLSLPMPAVAAIQGHAFAGGFILAFSHDVRLMRRDRGYLCLPEVELGVGFTPGMTKLLTSRLATSAQTRAMVFGERFAAEEALTHQMIDQACELDDLYSQALKRGAALGGRSRSAVARLKQSLNARALATLGTAAPPPEFLSALLRHGI